MLQQIGPYGQQAVHIRRFSLFSIALVH